MSNSGISRIRNSTIFYIKQNNFIIFKFFNTFPSVLAYWHLVKYFWLLLPFYGTIKETAVISYGKTKKIQNQTYG